MPWNLTEKANSENPSHQLTNNYLALLGEDSHFDEHIFQMRWFNHQLEKLGLLESECGLLSSMSTFMPPVLRDQLYLLSDTFESIFMSC